ncbi:MAG TPA: threonine synthase [Gemmatimonadales bacterium]|jgi:threonine synthase|nr:threonine synthase [Gemmatimonadales bacterium]
MTLPWSLECSACVPVRKRSADGLPGVCESCGAPYLVRYAAAPRPDAKALLAGRPWTMWRYREWLPLLTGESPVTLGEGGTPLLSVPRLGARTGFANLWIKEEGTNPTGSFKARGLAAAVTRAVLAGAKQFVVPTAGNAGVALAAYATRAGVRARVYAPATTPAPILAQIRAFGGDLVLLDGHIGDCGKAARAFAAESGAVDVSTLREPYRIEGKKTLGLELAEQLGWSFPDAIVYPTGGGTGLIGMWKAFQELRAAGWVSGEGALPRMYSVQATGCAPVIRAFETGAERCTPWPDPTTVAAGLRVPGPLGDRLMLQALRESGGGAVAVSDEALTAAAGELQTIEGIDAAPEGGAALAGAVELRRRGLIKAEERVVVFNTGAGWLYRA